MGQDVTLHATCPQFPRTSKYDIRIAKRLVGEGPVVAGAMGKSYKRGCQETVCSPAGKPHVGSGIQPLVAWRELLVSPVSPA